jgi:hypothetical protein
MQGAEAGLCWVGQTVGCQTEESSSQQGWLLVLQVSKQ